MLIIDFIYNLSILIAASTVSGFIDARWNNKSHRGRIFQGITFGCIAILSMLKPYVIGPGIITDGRSVVLSVCALFFGPIAGLIAGTMAGITRIMIGGSGAPTGVFVIIASITIGLIFHKLRNLHTHHVTAQRLYFFGLLVNLVTVLLMAVNAKNFVTATFQSYATTVILFYPIATVIIGKILIDQESKIKLFDELQTSEAKYRTLVEYSNDPICAINPDESFRFVNDAFAKAFNTKPEDIIGEKLSSIISHVGLKPELELVHRVLQTGNKGEISGKIITLAGEERFYLTMADAIKDEDGKILWVSCFIKDITDRKVSEDKLRQLSQAVEQSPVSIVITDTKGSIEYVNAKFIEVTGYTLAEVISQNPRILKSGYTSPEEYKKLWDTISAGGIWHGELHNQRKDGSLFWESARISPIIDANGKTTHYLAIKEDITERKQIWQTLVASEEKFRKAFKISPDAIAISRMSDGMYISVNQGFTEIMGYEESDVVGKTSIELNIWDTQADRKKLLEGLRENAVVNNLEIQFIRKNGKKVWGMISASIIELEGFDHILSITRDITERKLAEENLRRLEERLRLSEKMEAIGQLAGGIAHDFNNVLGGIIGYTDLSLGRVGNDHVLENNLLSVLKAAERAKNLVKQILTYSRRSNSAKSITLIKPIISEVIDLLKSSIPSSVNIESDLQAESKPILANSTQIHQVVLNLATNAVHAMDSKGNLMIRLYSSRVDREEDGVIGEILPGAYTVIEVSDTGSGMDVATLSKAFEPFFTTKAIGVGSGMGLSVVLGIVQSHQGNIQVKSVEGEGTIFKIYFPASEESIVVPGMEVNQTLLMGNERILFVDDEAMLLELAEQMLSPLGYTVICLSDSLEALKFIRNKANEIDILVTDQTMPFMLGTELAIEVKKIRKDLPIILCTGYSGNIKMEQALADGISRLVMKPYGMIEICTSIREALNTNNMEKSRV
jgi:two-component system, cell cycle sensor histidine kinase and response regulator CckA